MRIQQDIIVLWPWKVCQLEIFWENEFLIYDINNVTPPPSPQSVWEYFIIHRVCTCLFLSFPSQESEHIISLNFRERRLKWSFCVPSASSWTLHGWVVMAALDFLKRHRLCAPYWFSRTMSTGVLLLELTALSLTSLILRLFWKGQGLPTQYIPGHYWNRKKYMRGSFQGLLQSLFPIIKQPVSCPKASLESISISVLLSLRWKKSNIKLPVH